jgi:pimeloyl-ACP methyl ester carboxylesterase
VSDLPEVLYLSASPHLAAFDRPLVQSLSEQTTVAHWEYELTPDEPCSLEVALVLLHDYLKQCDRPVHLIGHGVSGLLGLMYAQRHPERAQSLVLLSVGAYPAVDWQAHYYAQRQILPCSRQVILTRMVDALFGYSSLAMAKVLVKILERDLDCSLSPHSLIKQVSLPPIEVSLPLLVCGSVDDAIIDPLQLRSWEEYFGENTDSRLWVCPGGRYFFHYFYSPQVAAEISCFWRLLSQSGDRCGEKALPLEVMSKNLLAGQERW